MENEEPTAPVESEAKEDKTESEVKTE